jgi:hypothetical protein
MCFSSKIKEEIDKMGVLCRNGAPQYFACFFKKNEEVLNELGCVGFFGFCRMEKNPTKSP